MDDYITPGVEHLASKYNILHGKEYKPVYGYINVPSFKVNNQRYSIENQEQSIREYCYRKQLQLTNIFVEDSSNCRLFDRTELSKLLLLLDNYLKFPDIVWPDQYLRPVGKEHFDYHPYN